MKAPTPPQSSNKGQKDLKSKPKRFEPPTLSPKFIHLLEKLGVELPKKPNATTLRWLKMAQLTQSADQKGISKNLRKSALKAAKQWCQRNKRKAKLGVLPELEEKILNVVTEKTNMISKMVENSNQLKHTQKEVVGLQIQSQPENKVLEVNSPSRFSSWSWVTRLFQAFGLIGTPQPKAANS